MGKLLGSILILGGCGGMGVFRAASYQGRVDCMEEILSMIQSIHGEIRVSSMPLGQVFLRVSSHTTESLGTVLKSLSQCMEENRQKRFSDMWQEHWAALPMSLTEKDQKRFMKLGRELGYLDRRMQLQRLEEFCRQWEEALARERKNSEEKGKICRYMGMAAGAVLILLLI